MISKRPERPTHLTIDGWTVFVSVRDDEYERQIRVWRRKLKAAHPDTKGGSHTKFLSTHRAFTRWRLIEATWYANLGLTPPDGWRGARGLLERRRRLKGLTDGTETADAGAAREQSGD